MNIRASTGTRIAILPVLIALLFNALLVSPVAPLAAQSALALTGSTFDATDGNLVEDGEEMDGCTPGLGVVTNVASEIGDGGECPGLNFVKTADVDPIDAGDEANFTLTVWNVGPGDAFDVTLHDDLPAGLAWDLGIVSGDATDEECMVASSIVPGGEVQMSIDCEFGTLGTTTMAGGIVIRVFADTDRTDCGLLENVSWVDASNDDRIDSDDSILVRCPTLVIDKVADTELITITGRENALVATPSVVTWTLTYTLTDGPVTNAVITDEIPIGFEFLDAADGGTLVDGVVTWTLEQLTESGSVTFRTTVDPETISRVAPTVNTAIIESDQTPEDEGQDSVTVTREGEQGGNPTPRPPLPNTAIGTGLNGEPITVPIELLVAFFIGSLGALALANVKARNSRR